MATIAPRVASVSRVWRRPSVLSSAQRSAKGEIVCFAQSTKRNNIKVLVNDVGGSLGRAAIVAVTNARGMEIAGAVDSKFSGVDAGEHAGLEEPLELPILNDLVMVLGSLSQSKVSGVMVDFSTDSGRIYDNVRQATAFGMRSVVCAPNVDLEVVNSLSTFCEKASTGCIVCPTLSIGRVLLQQAAMAAAFHYVSVQIIESLEDRSSEVPSSEANSLANSLSELGRVYNEGDLSEENRARGAVLGEGVRVHSLLMPGAVMSSMDVRFSGPGELFSLKHDIGNVSALMPGLLLAIRRVVRLKSLVYGLEKIL